ncbi:hypothetical protein BKA62DRAFT_378084 [Auriculariales sp. MPI-PUGE-AT-0066]|nr:hypothetical protein BKA62DRAFT_378084 [Auriculariales sp. MPI-PUGE-AT-0066]
MLKHAASISFARGPHSPHLSPPRRTPLPTSCSQRSLRVGFFIDTHTRFHTSRGWRTNTRNSHIAMSRRYRKSVFQVQSSSSSPTGFFTAPTSVVAHSSPSPPSPSPPSPSPAHYIPPAPSAVPDSDTFVRETRRYRDLDASRSRSANASVSTSPPSHDDHSWESLSYSTHAATPDPGSSQPHTSPTASGTTIPGEPSMTRVTDVVDAQPPATIHTSRADGDERRQSAAPSLEQAQSQPSSRASSANAGLLSVGHFVPQAKSLLPRLPTPESEKPLHPPLYPEVSPPTPPPGWTFPPPPPPPAEGSGGAPPVGAWFSPVDFPDFASGDIPMPGADGSPDPAHFYFSSGPGFETDDKWARLRDIASRAVSPGSAGLRVDIVDLDQMASPVERQGQKTPYRGRGRRRKSRATLSGSPESKSPNGEARARSGEVRVTFEDGTAPGNPGIAPSPARSENPPSIPRPELKHARSKSLSPPRSPAMHNTSRQPLVAPSTPKRSRSPSPAQSSLTAPKSTSDSPEPSPPSIPSTPSLQNEDINAPSAKNSPQSSGQPQVTDLLPTSPSSPHDLPAADAHLTTPHRAFVGPCQWTELQRNVRDAAVKLDGPEAAFLDDVQPEIVVLGSDDSLRARLVEALVGVRLDVTPDHR